MAEAGRFRSDINGLRAWAVVSVVLYHFGFGWASGGFVGVDIFFVISGFLMTGIVVEGVSAGRFSIWQFYLARARRIVPALLFVAAVVLAVGWFLLMPSEYQSLGKHVRDTVLFSSNLRYLKEAGYFAVASDQKWLLHSWSLSVEWQFYLIYPVIILLVSRLTPGLTAIRIAVAVLFVVSFSWCLWLSLTDPERAFFTLGSRAWQMAAGGLVWLWSLHRSNRQVRPFAALLGLIAILAAIISLDETFLWPLPWSVVPVLGTAMVLAGQWQQTTLLVSSPVQWLGSRSYSIYLWHWPLVVCLGYFGHANDLLWILCGVIGSLVLAEASFRLVEEPGRHHLGLSRRPASVVLLFALTGVVAGTAQVVRKNDFPDRLPAGVAAIEAERENRARYLTDCTQRATSCRLGQGPVRAVLLGDSHAGALTEAVLAAGGPQAAIEFHGHAGCLLIFGARREGRTGSTCQEAQEWVRQELPQLDPSIPALLVLRTTTYLFGGSPGEQGQAVGKPQYYFSRPYDKPEAALLEEFRQQYLKTACAIAKHRTLYLLQPLPEMPVDVPNAMGKDLLLGRHREIGITLAAYRERHAFVLGVQDEARDACGARVLDPTPYLCKSGFCPGAENGIPLYYDDDHLGRRGAALLIPMLEEVFR